MELYEIMEICMILAFGCSWPMSVIKSYRVRTTKGKSLPFLILIFAGYICGIIGKLYAPSCKWHVVFFYVLNFVMIGTDLLLYVRNYHLDSLEKQENSLFVK